MFSIVLLIDFKFNELILMEERHVGRHTAQATRFKGLPTRQGVLSDGLGFMSADNIRFPVAWRLCHRDKPCFLVAWLLCRPTRPIRLSRGGHRAYRSFGHLLTIHFETAFCENTIVL